MTGYFLDTNIIVSGLLWEGNERDVLRLAMDGRIDAITSRYVIEEAVRVLRDKFGFDAEGISERIGILADAFRELVDAERAETKKAAGMLSDKKDAEVLAAVIKSGAVLVSGDKRLASEARRLVKVITAKELLETR